MNPRQKLLQVIKQRGGMRLKPGITAGANALGGSGGLARPNQPGGIRPMPMRPKRPKMRAPQVKGASRYLRS